MPLAEDLSAFFRPTEHGTPAVIAGAAVVGIFDDAYADGLEMADTGPRFLCREADARVVVGESISVAGAGFKVVERKPDGTGLVELVLEGEVATAGDGVAFTFNLPYLIGPANKKQNDHALFHITATSTWHLIGIRCPTADTGSANFSHYSSPDLRTWTEHAELTLGAGAQGDWRFIVYAPFIIRNPFFGFPGSAQEAWKYLMFFVGVTHQSGSTQLQKIGLAGCTSDALDAWTVLNGDAAIYWCGMDDTPNGGAYAAGAPWCNAATYNSAWGGASRDPCVFYDGADWYLILTTKQTGNTARQSVGLAKFTGGVLPDFAKLVHMPSAVMACSSDGLYDESPTLQLVGSRWFFTFGGQTGTRHQSTLSHPTTDPFSDAYNAGVLLNDTPPGTGKANEVGQIESLIYAISGHIVESGYYYYRIAELDFGNLTTHANGDYPAETGPAQIGALVGLRAGILDRSLRFHFGSTGGVSDAFYYQPVIGDEPVGDGLAASGMSGVSYINTAYKRYYPGWPVGTNATLTATGWIYSDAWTITKDRAELFVAGDEAIQERFVALVRMSDNAILHIATGHGSHVLRRVIWDLAPLVGTQVRLVVADLTTKVLGVSLDAFREYAAVGSSAAAAPAIPPVLANPWILDDLIGVEVIFA